MEVMDLSIVETLSSSFFGKMEIVYDNQRKKRYFRQLITTEEISDLTQELMQQLNSFISVMSKRVAGTIVFVNEITYPTHKSIIFEYCNGLSLYEECKKTQKVYSESECMEILTGIMQCFFNYEQLGGLFHHDMKPENIYRHNGQIKIGGLDLCEIDKQTSTRICGSVHYLAPEILSQLNLAISQSPASIVAYSRKSDIYSIGLIILELLCTRSYEPATNQVPSTFLSILSRQNFFQRMSEVNKLVHDVARKLENQDLAKVIKNMLEPFPEQRCNFTYLYHFCGIIKEQDARDSNSSIRDKLSVFCDPNICKMMEIRRLYYLRISHEFCLIQFMLMAAKEMCNLAFTTLLDGRSFEIEYRSLLIAVACFLTAKGSLLFRNLQAAITKRVNLFKIKNLKIYYDHKLSQDDVADITTKLSLNEYNKFQTDMITFIEDQLVKGNQQLRLVKEYESLEAHSNNDKLDFINKSLRELLKQLERYQSHSWTKIAFKEYMSLIVDCLKDEETFQFHSVQRGLFDWDEFLEKHKQIEKSYKFKQVAYPQ